MPLSDGRDFPWGCLPALSPEQKKCTGREVQALAERTAEAHSPRDGWRPAGRGRTASAKASRPPPRQ